MNHFFKFNREAIYRAFKGETGYGGKLPWSRRIGWLRYLILGGLILNTLDYERSFLFGAAPTGLPPGAQLMMSLYTLAITHGDEPWQKRKRAEAKTRLHNSLRTFTPGYLSFKDFQAFWSGEKEWREYFFYTKIKARKEEKLIDKGAILSKYGIKKKKDGLSKDAVLEKYGLK